MASFAIVGAGFSGGIIARELALAGHQVDVFESRSHVGGNCHTYRDPETGILVHAYGPHIFHTSSAPVWEYVNQFAAFNGYTNRVKAITERGVYSLPINLLTINQFFGLKMNPSEAKTFVEGLGDKTIVEPKTFEEQALRFVGPELYEAFFKHYTIKQWGVTPDRLPASILKRLPIRFDYNDNYFNDRYQGIPVEGYTALISRIFENPRVTLHLERPWDHALCGRYAHVFWSGPLDAWFGCAKGRLGYRTLRFERFVAEGDFQGNAVVNYCSSAAPFTRIAEHKHFAPDETHRDTVCFREYSALAGPQDVPYYPLRLQDDKVLLEDYLGAARDSKGVTFIGRLGTYRYLDMNVVVEEAMHTAKAVLQDLGQGAVPKAFYVSP